MKAKKTAQQLLAEMMEEGSRHQVAIGNDEHVYVVSAKRHTSFPSFSSTVVDRMYTLWDDVVALRGRLTTVDAENVAQAMESVLLSEVGPEPKSRVAVTMTRAKKEVSSELPTLPSHLVDLATALVQAKNEIANEASEHQEALKQVQQQRKVAEADLVVELAAMDQDHIKRVNIMESDGSTQSFYLRLKQPRVPPKRRITTKIMKKLINSALLPDLDPMRPMEALEHVCDPVFADRFLAALKDALKAHEDAKSPEPPAHRVALDRIRRARVAQE